MSLRVFSSFVLTATAAAAVAAPDMNAFMCEKEPQTAFPCDPKSPQVVALVYEEVMTGNEAHSASQLQMRKKKYQLANQAYISNPTPENLSLKRSAAELLRVAKGIWENHRENKREWKETVDCVHRHYKTPNLNPRVHWKAQDQRAGGGRRK